MVLASSQRLFTRNTDFSLAFLTKKILKQNFFFFFFAGLDSTSGAAANNCRILTDLSDFLLVTLYFNVSVVWETQGS